MPRRIDYDKVLNDVTSAWGGVLDMIGPAPPAVAQEQFSPLPSPFEDVLRWHENPSSLMPYIGQNSPMVDPVMPYTRWLDAGPPSISPGPLDRMAAAGPSATIRGLMQQGAASRGAAPPSMTIRGLEAADAARRAGTTPGSGSPKVDNWQAPSPVDGGQRSSSSPPPLSNDTGGYAVKPTVTRWLGLVEKYAAKYDVPPEAILAVMDTESSGNPEATSKSNGKLGTAKGLMQTLDLHYTPGQNPYDPETNLNAGIRFYANLYHKYGKRADSAMAGYFGGEAALNPDGSIVAGYGADANGTTMETYIPLHLKKLATYRQWYAAQKGQAAPASGSAGQAQMMQAQAAPSGKASGWNFFGGQRYPLTGGFRDTSAGYPSSGHRGLDIGAPNGAAVTAPTTATVVHAGPLDGGYGNAVVLQLPTGHKIILGHLSSVAAQVGQQVQAGAALGNVGTTGKSSGPHLHVEVSDAQNNLINPNDIFDFA